MSLTNQSLRIAPILVAISFVVTLWVAPAAATPVLDIRIPDTLVTTDSTVVWVDVFMTNTADSVAGFNMLFVLGMPNLIEFMTEGGAPVVDTSQTLISDWGMVNTTLIGGSPHVMKIIALANYGAQPRRPCIAPRALPGLLFRMKMKIYPYAPGTLPDRTVHLMINENLDQTSFGDQNSDLIGITMETDTTYHYWQCTQWQGDTCLNWIQIPWPEGADSTSIEIFEHAVVDTNLTHIQSGTMRVVPLCHGVCGDANNDSKINIADAVFLISYVFRSGAAPYEDKCADPNNDYQINVGDAVFLINHIFRGGNPPDCTPY